MSNAVIYSNDSNFINDVLHSDTPVLVDFYADWCPPCQMIAPMLEDLADDYQGKIKVVKINVDQNPLVSAQLGVRNIPTLMTFKNGALVERTAGAMPKSQLAAFMDKAI